MKFPLPLRAIVCSSILWSAAAAETGPKPIFPGATPTCACEDLLKVALPNTAIQSAAIDPNDGSCRVTAIVNHPPAKDRVTVWIALPMTNWNGRFRGTGGGGFVGGHTNSLRSPVKEGFATGATDTGHEGGSGSFALDEHGRLNWQLIIDNAYLGIHEMTVVGKALTEKFYGKAPKYSYFTGASTGGRQGLMEAQRYPEDYDGIISGCPAIYWHRFVAADIWPQVAMVSAKNFVSKAKLDAATAAAIEHCDEKDRVKDGVIEDPTGCAYDPRELIGKKIGDETFTEADAKVIRQIWDGPRGVNGDFLWYGMARGADLNALAGTAGSPLSGRPFPIALDYVKYYLAQDPKLDYATIDIPRFEQLWRQSVEQYGEVLGTDNPDLTRFRDRGGKVIILFGTADQLIPWEGAVHYYREVQKQMGGPKRTADFARLFLVPGVDHGFRGPGPTPVGYFEALMRWVEEGKAPDKLMGERRDRNGKLLGKRPIYPYPSISKYDGSGDPDDPENWKRVTPTGK